MAIDVAIDDARRERLPRAVWVHPENRHWYLLAAGAAVGDVEVALPIERGVVDLMESGGERRCDVDERRLAVDAVDADRGGAAVDAAR